tara:strand:- start:114 stop:587 length:474 start_codon:yes stop_codon:yes gene_type:complete
MKTATVTELKKELKTRSQTDLVELCLKLSKFKKENKELLTYLLYEADNEQLYIVNVKQEIDLQFLEINRKSTYIIQKNVRKIQRNVKKYIRYSKQKETEIQLLMHFSHLLYDLIPTVNSSVLVNLFNRQIEIISKKIGALHEDLQFDYERELEDLLE